MTAPQQPVSTPKLPASWTAIEDPQPSTGSASPDNEWWRLFGSAELDSLVAQALNESPKMAAAKAAISEQAALARMAGADRLPRIDAQLGATRGEQAIVGFPVAGEIFRLDSESFDIGLTASWEADFWGRLRANRRGSLAELAAVRETQLAARSALIGAVVRTWLTAIVSRDALALAESHADSHRRTFVWLDGRYRLGLASFSEQRLAAAEASRTTALVTVAERRLDAALRRLEVLIGRYPAAELKLESAMPRVSTTIDRGAPAELLSRRPDLRAAEHRLKAAGWQVAAARAALFPRLSLVASGGLLNPRLAGLLDGNFSVWNVVGGLLQPIFEGGRLRASVDRSLAHRDRELARYVELALSAYRDVETALAAEQLLAAERVARQQAANRAREAAAQAERRFRSGLVDYLVVHESQRSAARAASELLQVRHQRLTTRVDLYQALGGGSKGIAQVEALGDGT